MSRKEVKKEGRNQTVGRARREMRRRETTRSCSPAMAVDAGGYLEKVVVTECAYEAAEGGSNVREGCEIEEVMRSRDGEGGDGRARSADVTVAGEVWNFCGKTGSVSEVEEGGRRGKASCVAVRER